MAKSPFDAEIRALVGEVPEARIMQIFGISRQYIRDICEETGQEEYQKPEKSKKRRRRRKAKKGLEPPLPGTRLRTPSGTFRYYNKKYPGIYDCVHQTSPRTTASRYGISIKTVTRILEKTFPGINKPAELPEHLTPSLFGPMASLASQMLAHEKVFARFEKKYPNLRLKLVRHHNKGTPVRETVDLLTSSLKCSRSEAIAILRSANMACIFKKKETK